MKQKIILRTASIVMFLHDVGHSFGTLTWKRATDQAKQKVINEMTDNKFPLMGASRSMAETYDGYGFAIILALLLMAILLWFVSDPKEQKTALSRKIIVTLAVVLLAWGIVELLFFFPFAAAFSLIASLLCIYSFATQ